MNTEPFIHIGEIHRQLGDEARKDWTPTALEDAREVGPWRFTFHQPEVKYVNQHLWGQPVEVVKGSQFNPHLWPEAAFYGKRGGKRGGIRLSF